MVSVVDKANRGIVKFPDFLEMMATKVDEDLQDDDIREAFTIFDNDGNGTISRSELRHIMLNLGLELTEDECETLFKEADMDMDGTINYQEFVVMMTSAG